MYKVLKSVAYMGRIYKPGETIQEKAPGWLEKKWIENRVVAFEKEAATAKKAKAAPENKAAIVEEAAVPEAASEAAAAEETQGATEKKDKKK